MIQLRYRGWYGKKPFIFKSGPGHNWIVAHPEAGAYEGFEVNAHHTHTDAIKEVNMRAIGRGMRAIVDGAQ